MSQLIVTAMTGDGVVRNTGTVFATVRSSATGTAKDNAGTTYSPNPGCTFIDPTYYMDRVFWNFDTSSIPGGSTIDSATLTFYVIDLGANTDTESYGLVESNVDTSTLATSDFGGIVAYTDLGRIARASLTSGANNTITLNATGLTKIVLAGTTKLAFCSTRDWDNLAPTGNNYLNVNSGRAISNKPTLTVNYTLAASGGIVTPFYIQTHAG